MKQQNKQAKISTDAAQMKPAEEFDAEYLRLIKLDLADAQAHLDDLPESERRGLSLDTYRHFNCGYLKNWVLTEPRAKLACGIYVDEKTGKVKKLPPPSERIIIPTPSMNHFGAVATPRARRAMDKKYHKQHAGEKELFYDPDALKADTLVVVEGEVDAMSIWQATHGEVAVVATLGCSNQKKTLGARLHELKGKRFIILFDADEAGRKNAKALRKKLSDERYPAVFRFLYDYLPADLKKAPRSVKIDANGILKYHGADMLCSLMKRVIESAEPELDSAAKKIEEEKTAAGNEVANPSLTVRDTAQTQKSAAKNYDDDTDDARRIIADALKFIPASKLSRDEWFAVGCVLRRYGFTLADFDAWSNDGDRRYSADACRQQWDSMKSADELKKDEGYKIGTVIKLAQANGFNPALMDVDLKDFLLGGTTDVAHALRLEKFLRDNVKWLEDDERWLVWRDGVWHKRSDKKLVVYPAIFKLAARAKKAMKNFDDEGDPLKRKDAWAKIYALEDTKTINPVISALTACRSIRITADDLDAHPNLLCVKNGVIDLRTGKLYDADPKLLLTQQANVAFDPQADTTEFNNFFASIMPNEETRRGLLRWLGYNLTGDVREERFMIWLGSGANGKGVLSRTLAALLGDYAAALPRTALVARHFDDGANHTANLMPLVDARFAISEEIAQNVALDGAWLKTLSGGDLLNLAPKYKEFRKVKPTAKLNFSSNYVPKVENVADDDGMKRRLLIMPFTQSFTGSNCNPRLKTILMDEKNLRGLLRILVAEARAWYLAADAEKCGLIISSEMTTATKENIQANDFLSDALDEFFVRDEKAQVTRRAVIDLLKEKIPQARRYSDRDLTKMMEKRGFEYKKTMTGRVFVGLRFANPSDEFSGENINENDISCP